MKVLFKEPNRTPELINLPPDEKYKVWADKIGGRLEEVRLAGRVMMYADDNGINKGLPLNFVIDGIRIFGPALFVGFEHNPLRHEPISDQQVRQIRLRLDCSSFVLPDGRFVDVP